MEQFGEIVRADADSVLSGASTGVTENAFMTSTEVAENQLLDMEDDEKKQIDMEMECVKETLDEAVEDIKRMTA